MRTVSQGSLRERAKGKWQIRFHVIENGNGRIVSRTVEASSRRRAREIGNQIREELIDIPSNDRSDVPLRDYMYEYARDRFATGLIVPSTLTNYEVSAGHILRDLPNPEVTLGELSATDIQKMEAGMLSRGLCNNTVIKDFRFLKQVMAYAEDMEHISKTPFKRSLKPPRRTKPVPNALTEASRAVLLETVGRNPDSRIGMAARLGLLAGLRREEVCGLRWEDVSFEDRTLSVVRAIGVHKNETFVKDPKTESSSRTIPLEEGLAADLRDWLVGHAMRQGGSLGGYVLGEGERYYSPVMLTKEFTALSKTLGLTGTAGKRACFHDLRDTFATNLIDSGVSPRTAADLLGHSDPSMTLRVYTASTRQGLDAAVTAIGRLADIPS